MMLLLTAVISTTWQWHLQESDYSITKKFLYIVIEHEKQVLLEQAKVEAEEDVKAGRKPKPEAVLEKMVNGRIEKFYKENCLLEQAFIKDGDKTVTDIINENIAKIGENINVRRFVRYGLGEGIEKRQDDFVAEVMASVGK